MKKPFYRKDNYRKKISNKCRDKNHNKRKKNNNKNLNLKNYKEKGEAYHNEFSKFSVESNSVKTNS